MALTWATEVRLGRVTSQNEWENELYLAANRLLRAEKTLISISFFHFLCFFKFLGILFLGLCLARYLF
ncbi:hypothetical protein HanIR_Chr15g0733321 [Helianthus annuus]|nr:hypothetical protein HanIR_Chr15g0733321 [Helianthus annuus]